MVSVESSNVTVLCWLCAEFFEELLSLVYSLTSRQISARMWQILPHLYRLFYDDNIDLFVGESSAADWLLCYVPSHFMLSAGSI